MKHCVTGIIFRRDHNGVEIMTQLRLVQNKSYDPLYDQTWEVVSGLIEMDKDGCPKERVVEAVLREVSEECGVLGFQPVEIQGASGQTIWTTGKGDKFLCVEPFCFVQSMGPPQPWIGPVFLVEVDHNFEPDQSKSDGEAGKHRWWLPKELLEEIKKNPGGFMGLHIGPLEKFCEAAIAGRI